MEKRWKILPVDTNKQEALSASLKINATSCKILTQRGIDSFDKAKLFFRPSLSELPSPWLMKGMDIAVKRILLAIEQNEKILIYGDYDVDGTTSVASMFQFIQSIYPNTDYYIPHRYKEGYGVSKQGIDHAKEHHFSLIISLDCGIKSVDLIAYAKSIDIDFIVCDHHQPDALIPPAVAILNPKQIDCPYPYKELCGCGVGFKLMMAIAERLNLPESSYLDYLDLVATAIAADIVPITGENRILAYYGIKKVNEAPCAGILALRELAKSTNYMHISNLVFVIAPRINAAGRMDDAKKAVQLFIEKDYQKALAIGELLQSDNIDRREADTSITEEALASLLNNPKEVNKKTTVVYQPHWHKGVVGIVASRLIETYYRPTIVLTKSGEIVAGSARSVAGFNLYEAIHACREHLIGYGGHFAAAGMTLLPENVLAFSDAFEQAVSERITQEQLIPEILIDAEIHFSEINNGLFNILSQMEPFGPENMRPVFIARKVYNTGMSKIVKDLHIRFVLTQNNYSFTGIGFKMAEKFPILSAGNAIDVVFTIDENEWNGNKNLQLKIIDFKASEN